MSITVEESTFTGTGVGGADPAPLKDKLNVTVDFTTGSGIGTIQLQRSFNKGVKWYVMESYTADTSKIFDEPEHGVEYRLNCSAFTSGTIAGRLSR